MNSPEARPGITLLRRSRLLAASVSALALLSAAVAAESPSGPVILEKLKDFGTMGTVLHIAAHPDDENTQALTALAKGRNFRTAYLSVTRGDGGQNEIGPEFDAELGLARTQELLAARRIDGARQFFTRALDFGYSKHVDETLRIWDREKVLGDVVRVIRTFRPDAIFTQSSPQQTPGNHGHHVAAAVLGVEAFKIAGDPQAYPEQIAEGLTPWQPRRIVQGAGGINTTGTDPVTGDTFQAIAGRSRAMHYTQFGIPGTNARGGGGGRGGAAPAGGRAGGAAPGGAQAGAARGGGAAPAGGGRGAGGGGRGGGAPIVLGGEAFATDIMEGVDTTWARVPNGGAEIGRLTDAAIEAFKTDDPAASVPALLDIHRRLAGLPADPVLEAIIQEKRALLDSVIADSLGLTVETLLGGIIAPGAAINSSGPVSSGNSMNSTRDQELPAGIVPGESFSVHHSAGVRSSSLPVRWMSVRFPTLPSATPMLSSLALSPGSRAGRGEAITLPVSTPLSQPYWLREPAATGLFTVAEADRRLIGRPENPPVLPVEYVFEIGGQSIVLTTEPIRGPTNAAGSERADRINVISPVTVHFTSLTRLFTPGASGPVEVELTANRPNITGTLALDLPAGWTSRTAPQNFQLGAVGTRTKYTFTVTAPAAVGSVNLGAHVIVNGQRFSSDRVVIDYAHLPFQLLQPTASTRAVSVDLAVRGRRIGYFTGAGDDVAECIAQMGYQVTMLTGADLTAEKLQGLDAVVIGVRAFDEKPELLQNFPALLAWVEAGGTVIAQYNRGAGQFGPYPIGFQGGAPARRTTDETSPFTRLAPEHPVLNIPNRITDADFAGWVQERGTYYPSSWDTERYTPILAFTDPGEEPNSGPLLVARHGQGYYVYTGIAFFRQLPRGVPGAYRLFANLVSLGK